MTDVRVNTSHQTASDHCEDVLLQPLPSPNSVEGILCGSWDSDLLLDIVLYMIDTTLGNDKTTLYNLSLTCSILHAHAQKLIFKLVRLPYWIGGPCPYIKRFLAILHHDPRILTCIQTLVLDVRLAPPIDPDVRYLCFTLHQHFPNLTAVVINLERAPTGISSPIPPPGVSHVPWPAEFRNPLMQLMKNHRIKHLSIFRNSFDTGILRYAEHVERLCFQDFIPSIDTSVDRTESGSEAASSRTINRATENSIAAIPIMRPKLLYLHSPSYKNTTLTTQVSPHCAIDFSQTTTFRFVALHREAIRLIPGYLPLFSHSLAHLSIYNCFVFRFPDQVLSLSTLTGLRFITLSISLRFVKPTETAVPNTGDSYSPSTLPNVRINSEDIACPLELDGLRHLEWLTTTLASLPNPCNVASIKLLIVLLSCTGPQSVQNIDWASFDRTVFGCAASRGTGLARHFEYTNTVSDTLGGAWVQRQNRKWCKLKKLEIVFIKGQRNHLLDDERLLAWKDGDAMSRFLGEVMPNFAENTDGVVDVKVTAGRSSIWLFVPQGV
ncbi:hypothetical protein CVT24_002308 [Panaeolus cyanescens]|uniref:Uncharacterized protein n=1 Tax=Panaeolus cyanescens TaxID=181874 RepID=A0A409YIS0_9AGAR|nr:hypothetical protein CVT24_002308 [Panaeolus cyanescens]